MAVTCKNIFENFYRLQRNNFGTNATENWQIVQFSPLTLRKPNNEAAPWRIGDTKQINWSYADSITTDSIRLMICSGNSTTIGDYKYNISTGLTAEYNGSDGNGTYNWTIPANITNSTAAPADLNLMNNSLRIAIIDDTLDIANRSYDYSNNPFEIIGAINNVTPSGTASPLNVGQTYPINWTKAGNFNYSSTGINSNFTVQLSTDGTGANYTNITGMINLPQENCACSPSNNNCSLNWTVPFVFNGTTPLLGSTYLIKVYDNSHSTLVYNTSLNNFTIAGAINVTAPNGNETWLVGETNHYINWTKQGNYSTSNFTIALSQDGGGNWTNISALTNLTQTACGCAASNNCSILWSPIPDNINTGLRIKVFAVANPVINDTSDFNFTIKGVLERHGK